jgi:hypothetical protein
MRSFSRVDAADCIENVEISSNLVETEETVPVGLCSRSRGRERIHGSVEFRKFTLTPLEKTGANARTTH